MGARQVVDGSVRELARRRLPALVALGALLVLGMLWVEYWIEALHGLPIWLAPPDLWGSYLAAVSLVHGHLGGLYTPTTGLVAFPGIAYLLSPVAALGSALHLSIGPNYTAITEPTAWVVAGPYEMVLASVPLFAFDAVAERWGVARPRRYALALAEAAALSNVVVKWGHPEDAVSLGLVVFAALDADAGNWRRCAWLLGFAIAVQPFAVLAVPAILAPLDRIDRRRLARLVVALALPSAAVLAGPLAANWHETIHALTDQPNYPLYNHPTPWTSLLPRLPGRITAVASGPGRVVAVVVAVAAGVGVCRRGVRLETTFLVVGFTFFLRIVGEPVLDSFYVWPVIALMLVLAARRGSARLGAATLLALGATWLSNVHWGGVWPWWLAMLGVLVVALVIASPLGPRGPALDRRAEAGPDGSPVTGVPAMVPSGQPTIAGGQATAT